MDKAKWGKIEGGRWGWVRPEKVVMGKWRQLYLNIIKKMINSPTKKPFCHLRKKRKS